MVIEAIAIAVFVSAVISIAKDIPKARQNLCIFGSKKCEVCYGRFICFTKRD